MSYSPYKNIYIKDYDPYCEEIAALRNLIIEDIKSNPRSRHVHMLDWFTESGWENKASRHTYTICSVIYDNKDNFIGMTTSIDVDNTLKVLVKYYLMSEYAVQYRGISQTDIIPHCVDYARKKQMEYIWLTVHTFDKRHQRLSDSIKNKLNGSGIPREQMPYYEKWEYVGEIKFHSVMQDKFICEI